MDTDFFPFENGLRERTDKYGLGVPNPIHLFLGGSVADDLSFVTNRLATLVSGSDSGIIIFRFGKIPSSGVTSLKLKFRWRTDEEVTSFNDFFIVAFQGRPNNVRQTGGVGAKFWFEGSTADDPAAFTRLGQVNGVGAADTWFDEEIVITPGNITDPNDLWVSIEADSDLDDAVIKISFVVLEVTGSFSLVDTPTFKNYVNSLQKLGFISVIQKGTKGTDKYCYVVVPCDSSGICGPPSDEVSITDGNATLDATNHICLSWLDTGATNYRVYRTCSPSGLGLGLLATVLPNLGDCGTGGGGGGDTGYKDDGTDCVTDCDDVFNPDDFEGCEGKTIVTIPSKETPTVVIYGSKETPT